MADTFLGTISTGVSKLKASKRKARTQKSQKEGLKRATVYSPEHSLNMGS